MRTMQVYYQQEARLTSEDFDGDLQKRIYQDLSVLQQPISLAPDKSVAISELLLDLVKESLSNRDQFSADALYACLSWQASFNLLAFPRPYGYCGSLRRSFKDSLNELAAKVDEMMLTSAIDAWKARKAYSCLGWSYSLAQASGRTPIGNASWSQICAKTERAMTFMALTQALDYNIVIHEALGELPRELQLEILERACPPEHFYWYRCDADDPADLFPPWPDPPAKWHSWPKSRKVGGKRVNKGSRVRSEAIWSRQTCTFYTSHRLGAFTRLCEAGQCPGVHTMDEWRRMKKLQSTDLTHYDADFMRWNRKCLVAVD